MFFSDFILVQGHLIRIKGKYFMSYVFISQNYSI